jgi:hypothetical protein
VSVAKEQLRDRARAFAVRWASAVSEQADRQTFWNDFFAIFGIDRRQVATFEQLAAKATTGGYGRIDLLYPGQMGVEHKSAGEDLDKAMTQLLDYLPSLTAAQHPWLLIACDFRRFRWYDLLAGAEGEFLLEELGDNIDMFAWLAGHTQPHQHFDNVEDANLAATSLLAELHDRLRENDYGGHALREWLTRVLFCMFADDTGVWDRAAFHAYVAMHTREDGADLGAQLAFLFQVLDTPPRDRSPALDEELRQFTYIDGDIFEEPLPIPACDQFVREALLEACRFDWTAISPAIFGSMFQNVMTPDERRKLGAHYTSEENILRTIRPLFLEEFEQQLAAADSKPKLRAFLDRVASTNFFDPACGCGNFLVIAYREVRRLETEALRRLRSLERRAGQLTIDITLECRVRVDQFHGIESEEFPAKIARTALYLIDHLANREVSQEFGQHYVRFPIPASPGLRIANAATSDWEQVLPASRADYVFGNPPFSGMSFLTPKQHEDRAHAFSEVDSRKLREGRLDYVSSWYAKALAYAGGRPIRFAFVSTNSLFQGEQARSMGALLARHNMKLDFAYRTFRWRNEAYGPANVHVVIVGFSRLELDVPKRLYDFPEPDGMPVERRPRWINGYLADAPDVDLGKRKEPFAELPIMTEGNRPEDGGHLIVRDEEVPAIRRNDPTAAQYLRPLLGAQSFLHGAPRWCFWLVDADPSDLRNSRTLRERLRQVREERLALVERTNDESRKFAMRAKAEVPGVFTSIRQPTRPYVIVPRHSSAARNIVPMRWCDPTEIAHDTTLTLEAPPMWVFGVLQSSMFTAWVRAVCGALKSDIRIAPDLAYHSFPMTEPDARNRMRVEEATQDVLEARGGYAGSSLAELYDPLVTPRTLYEAHEELDRSVNLWMAPRRRRRIAGDADRLSVLFTRLRELAH